jgi:hypothetical protein
MCTIKVRTKSIRVKKMSHTKRCEINPNAPYVELKTIRRFVEARKCGDLLIQRILHRTRKVDGKSSPILSIIIFQVCVSRRHGNAALCHRRNITFRDTVIKSVTLTACECTYGNASKYILSCRLSLLCIEHFFPPRSNLSVLEIDVCASRKKAVINIARIKMRFIEKTCELLFRNHR